MQRLDQALFTGRVFLIVSQEGTGEGASTLHGVRETLELILDLGADTKFCIQSESGEELTTGWWLVQCYHYCSCYHTCFLSATRR